MVSRNAKPQKPPVEAGHESDDGLRVVLQELLVEHAERREEPYGLQALPLDDRGARLAVHVLGG